MEISFCNSNDKNYQYMLNRLLKDIFLDFRFYYDLDLWNENYESYSIIKYGEMLSNICVFRTKLQFSGKEYLALSIGAVATKEEHRGKGLSRILLEHILEKYKHVPMYLYANETVLDFYPKFGFKRAYEKLPVYECKINNNIKPAKLSFDDPKVWNYVFKRVNFCKELDCLNTASINIFHIYWGYLKECIYEIPEIETMIIAEQKGTTLKIIGVFSLKETSFSEFLGYLPFSNVQRIECGFMPHWTDIKYSMQEYECEHLFARGASCDLGNFKFPELSIT
jgi:predicted GNAT family N-acyltransferase